MHSVDETRLTRITHFRYYVVANDVSVVESTKGYNIIVNTHYVSDANIIYYSRK